MTNTAASSSNPPLSVNPVNTQTWVNGRHLVRCVKVIQETWDVRTFCFMADQPIMFFFKPGQFVTLELSIDDEQVMRSYTISSSPSVPYSFSISVKRVPGGRASNWLHDHLRQGDRIAVHGPVGQFNAIDFPADKVLFLSGGVGITPVMSMSRWFFDTNAAVDMVFVHSARSPRDVIFQRELEHMASRIDNFALHLICERHGLGEPWAGYRGFLGLEMLRLIAADFLEREIFCCGPAPYMAAVRALLVEQGFNMNRYHEESFGATPVDARIDAVEQAEQAEQAPEPDRSLMHLVEFAGAGKSVRVSPEETVHAAAAKLGLHIPKACGMGICGTCKVMKQSGEVVMEHNGGITEEDEAEGYILSCCSRPCGDVLIDF
ncbi:hybrid-cluster NAD(P)-dependent oxidoreductase [Halotalea alkalilenta]|uniref:Hybrid-cluster NAD(P)-dependent oxidoreductase n=1 Tax=Halotalea alkalilenta TaxID=376489 RepID=A0A172YEB3_9GAMM|nr:hybrid-cluster NAD(P)-dependent oxidoreductase [Halotalea alkalilenta]ANF57432.1 hybrid-cluster NAD(P)-dependent oxidoreductase [Halotalea alkalilenta]